MQVRFEMQLNTDHKVFSDSPSIETMLLLEEVRKTVSKNINEPCGSVIKDRDGKTIGRWELSIDKSPDKGYIINADVALNEIRHDDELHLYLVEIGMFDMEEDTTTPYDSVQVLTGAVSKEEAEFQGRVIAENEVKHLGYTSFFAINDTEIVDPEDYE